jgi:ribosome-associated protein
MSDPASHPEGVEFELVAGAYIELHRLLKATGLCQSGGVAKLLIGDGQVLVDGVVELRKRRKVRVGQVVEMDACRIVVCAAETA